MKKQKREKAPRPPPRLTRNGLRIWEMMAMHKVRGNPKDYVLFVDDMMIDAYGAFRLSRVENGEPITSGKAVALVHKRSLSKIIGKDVAARFWDPRLRRRTNFGQPPASGVRNV